MKKRLQSKGRQHIHTILNGEKALDDGIDELNAISSIFGNGKGAIGARSITVEDVNQITGYNPNNTGNGEPYAKGKAEEYGNSVTYYSKSRYPYYVGNNGTEGSVWYSHNGYFKYYNGDKWVRDSLTSERKDIITLTSTSYIYYATTLTPNRDENSEIKGISEDSKEYSVLFGAPMYWLASSCIECQSQALMYELRLVDNGKITSNSGTFSAQKLGTGLSYFAGVRPIVTLSSNAVITKDATHDGSTQEKACTLTVE